MPAIVCFNLFRTTGRALVDPKQHFVICSTPEQDMEERKCNYERYRGLVQNDFANSEYDSCHWCRFHTNICREPQQQFMLESMDCSHICCVNKMPVVPP